MLFSSCLVVLAPAQEKTVDPLNDLYRQTEQIYSTDDLLVNGQFYVPEKPRAQGSPYFGNKGFQEAALSIKGRLFEKVKIKYDLANQRLILQTTLESGQYVPVMLNNELVDSFHLAGTHFINARHYDASVSGFYALVYEGRFSFLIRYEKSFRAVYDNQTPNGSYTDSKANYFLYRDGKLTALNGKKNLLKYFSPVKSLVKTYLRKNRIKYQKADTRTLNQLMKYCDSISTNP